MAVTGFLPSLSALSMDTESGVLVSPAAPLIILGCIWLGI